MLRVWSGPGFRTAIRGMLCVFLCLPGNCAPCTHSVHAHCMYTECSVHGLGCSVCESVWRGRGALLCDALAFVRSTYQGVRLAGSHCVRVSTALSVLHACPAFGCSPWLTGA